MNGFTKKTDEITFRKVYLSDLKAVLDIYQETRSNLSTDKLTTQFGLPLAIAEHSNKLIGFASAKCNESEEVEITSYYKNGICQSNTQTSLEELAKSTVYSSFDTGPEAVKKIKNATDRLVTWLNNCS
ncbi:MAG: hypothetical protein WC623_09570 [Pedobacter sp.]|uniref:hypothetical protein n=1 Tax=Pedobacter sp. TaxID=1411316 RepID=UPI00356A3113